MTLFIETHFSPKCNGKPCGGNRCGSHPVPPAINKKSPDNRLRTFVAEYCPRLMCSASTMNAKERCNGGSGLSIGVSLFQTIVFSCRSFHKRELVGARPLHLADARPFGRLKAPLGLSLLRFAPQTRTCRGEVPYGERSGSSRFLQTAQKSTLIFGVGYAFNLCRWADSVVG